MIVHHSVSCITIKIPPRKSTFNERIVSGHGKNFKATSSAVYAVDITRYLEELLAI